MMRNDLSPLCEAEKAVWVNTRWDICDGSLELASPTVFLGSHLDQITQTHLGFFLGSVAYDGYAGLRPVTSYEMESVLDAMDSNASESAMLEDLQTSPEEAWRSFLGRSTQDMLARVVRKLSGEPVSTVDATGEPNDEIMGNHINNVVKALFYQIPIRLQLRGTDLPHNTPPPGPIVELDIFELFGLDSRYTPRDRADLAEGLLYLEADLDRPDDIVRHAQVISEPLSDIIERLDAVLPAVQKPD